MKKRIRNRSDLEVYILKSKSLPEAFKREIISWKEIAHSPYSHSYYSSKSKRWNHTPINCRRVSNHWNFKGKSRAGNSFIRSKTDIPVKNNTYWTLAEFDGKVWKVIQSLPIRKK